MPQTPPIPIRPFIYDPPHPPFVSVVHCDDELLVLSKPSGLLSVPGKATEHGDCLERRAQSSFPGATTVHRLDNATSGIMIMARNARAHRHIGMQFERRHTKKIYIARVWGHLAEDSGRVDLPLICDWPNRPRQHVNFERGKPSQTDWEVMARETSASGIRSTRVRLMPFTGRSHQLRVHMQSLGHPILGDRFYAPDDALHAADRLQLHAQSLTLFHPSDGRVCTFEVVCPF